MGVAGSCLFAGGLLSVAEGGGQWAALVCRGSGGKNRAFVPTHQSLSRVAVELTPPSTQCLGKERARPGLVQGCPEGVSSQDPPCPAAAVGVVPAVVFLRCRSCWADAMFLLWRGRRVGDPPRWFLFLACFRLGVGPLLPPLGAPPVATPSLPLGFAHKELCNYLHLICGADLGTLWARS